MSGALGRLVHAGYITAIEQEFRFLHPLVHEVAYGRLPLAERMHLHARYAREGADPEDAEALAHHWWRAMGEPDAEWVWEDERELALPPRRPLPRRWVETRNLCEEWASSVLSSCSRIGR